MNAQTTVDSEYAAHSAPEKNELDGDGGCLAGRSGRAGKDRANGGERVLGRGPRIFGTLALGVLALLSLVWIIRDFLRATEVLDVWWMWSGLLFRAQDGVWATSFVEPTLLVLYTVCAVTVARSSSAAGILASTGVLTVALRLPSLWNLNATWVRGGVSTGLREKALISVVALIALGIALIVVAAAGRRPVDRALSADEAPARPSRGGAIGAFLLLTATACVLVAWQLYALRDQGWTLYLWHIAGDRSLVTLLAVPENFLGWVLAALCLAAALASLARTLYARPLGMTVCAPLLGLGGFYVSFGVRAGLSADFAGLGITDQLRLCTAVFEVAAGLGVLGALSRRAAEPDRAD